MWSVLNGRSHSAGGWWFKYEDDDRVMPSAYGPAAARQKRDKKVYAVNLKTGERREFRNCTVADKDLAMHHGSAARVASGKRASTSDWWFTYDSKQNPPEYYKGDLVAIARSKAIIAERLVDGSLFRFKSAKDAAAELGISRAMISKIINGKSKVAKGYTFRQV